jgi:hypothetical protein
MIEGEFYSNVCIRLQVCYNEDYKVVIFLNN